MDDKNFANRRKRVNRLKKIIVGTVLAAIIIPIVACIMLAVNVRALKQTATSLENSISELSEMVLRQQKLLEELSTEQEVVYEGSISELQTTVVKQTETIEAEEQPEEETEVVLAAHKVYLTFDDGPSGYTDDILDILKRYDVKATFFVTGKEDEASRELLKRIVEEGHTLGMHSYSHKYRDIYRSEEDFVADFEKLRTYLYDVTGVESRFYRFPGGSSNTVSRIPITTFEKYLAEQEVTFFDWNISSGDAGSVQLDVDTLVKNSTRGIEDWETAVILFHDSLQRKTTVEALPIVIEKILELEDTVILPISEETQPVQHISP